MIDQEKDITAFAFILYRCAIAYKNELNKEFTKEFGEDLNADYWFILSALWEEDNISHGLLAERTSRDKASLSRTLDSMEQQGIITRITDPNDKRGSRVSLTKKSTEIRNRANLTAYNFSKKELYGLSPIEIKELIRMTNKIFDNLKT